MITLRYGRWLQLWLWVLGRVVLATARHAAARDTPAERPAQSRNFFFFIIV